jgi:hypothetical protein
MTNKNVFSRIATFILLLSLPLGCKKDSGPVTPVTPPTEQRYVGRLVSALTWPLSAGTLALLTPENRHNLESRGFQLDGQTLVFPQMPMPGYWVQIAGKRLMCDTLGYFHLSASSVGGLQGQVFEQYDDTIPKATFTSANLVPEGQSPTSIKIADVLSDPADMNPSNMNTLEREKTGIGCPMHDACPPGNNVAGCCLDYDGRFGNHQPLIRNGNIPDSCKAQAYLNFISSTCFEWSTTYRLVCRNERAYPPFTGPTCWENHKYRNCQNLSRTDFFVQTSGNSVGCGGSLSIHVRNNLPANETLIRSSSGDMKGSLSIVLPSGTIAAVTGGYEVRHYIDADHTHYNDVFLTYHAPSALPSGTNSITEVLNFESGGTTRQVDISVTCGFNGTYSGPVNGANTPSIPTIAFTVTNGAITAASAAQVTLSGMVSASGAITLSGLDCNGTRPVTFTGQIALTSSGGAAATGTWAQSPTCNSGYAYLGTTSGGTWTATRH